MDPATGVGQARPPGGGEQPPVPATAEMVLHEEQLRITTRRVPAERVRLVRRIVTETRMVPVEIRREVVDVERTPLDGTAVDGTALDGTGPDGGPTGTTDGGAAPVGPVVMVLREEYPVFTLGVRAVEQITATVTRVAGETAVRAEVSSERVEVIDVPPPAPLV